MHAFSYTLKPRNLSKLRDLRSRIPGTPWIFRRKTYGPSSCLLASHESHESIKRCRDGLTYGLTRTVLAWLMPAMVNSCWNSVPSVLEQQFQRQTRRTGREHQVASSWQERSRNGNRETARGGARERASVTLHTWLSWFEASNVDRVIDADGSGEISLEAAFAPPPPTLMASDIKYKTEVRRV